MDATIGEDDIIDISVTYDGSWQKRGFTSLYGVGTVIDLETGLIIYYKAFSLFCHVSILFTFIQCLSYRNIVVKIIIYNKLLS